MDGMILLREAKSAGLKITVDGTTLKIRGPKKAESVAQQLIVNKAVVLDHLNRIEELNAGVARWDLESAPLIKWFTEKGQHLIPDEPFQLSPWQKIVDPRLFKEAIFFGISVGPDKVGLRHGTFADDLKRLKELFDTDSISEGGLS